MLRNPIKVYWLSQLNEISCPAKPLHGRHCPLEGAVMFGQVAMINTAK